MKHFNQNPPIKSHLLWKIFPNLCNPHRPALSVPWSLVNLPMFVLSLWDRAGCRQQKSIAKDSDMAQSFRQVTKIRTDGEWELPPGLRKIETVPLYQSRWWVENLGRKIHLKKSYRYLRWWRQESSRAQQVREFEERVPKSWNPKFRADSRAKALIPLTLFMITLPAII